MKATDMNTDHAANDLTQLSSREQLSALMDSALPADQTRFLLRRLRHDDALAGCWERWRIAGETLRGLAPAQRLPADFAARVAAALHDAPPAAMPAARNATAPSWVRWGVGGAMAASLAMVALMARQAPDATPAGASIPARVVAAQVVDPAPAPVPAPDRGASGEGAAQQALAAATAVAAVARPLRESRRPVGAGPRQGARPDAAAVPALVAEVAAPATELVAKPWPRTILPQYANEGLAVGFGDAPRALLSEGNPFAAPPALAGLPAPHAALAEAAPQDDPASQASPAEDAPRP
ncbi:RseA family anti-sigma factor [Thermomonas sp.]|mgnify:FL=1|uniref:RseA family anti-sigma factor n=1 Tax=Thermomonas sp. TaxID=1971895 RepID=UPI0035B09C10